MMANGYYGAAEEGKEQQEAEAMAPQEEELTSGNNINTSSRGDNGAAAAAAATGGGSTTKQHVPKTNTFPTTIMRTGRYLLTLLLVLYIVCSNNSGGAMNIRRASLGGVHGGMLGRISGAFGGDTEAVHPTRGDENITPQTQSMTVIPDTAPNSSQKECKFVVFLSACIPVRIVW